MLIIPFTPLPQYTEALVLDSKTWVLGFTWNNLASRWLMSITSTAGLIIDGIALVPGILLLAPHVKDALPSGDFIILSPNGSTGPITFDNIGDNLNYLLLYADQSEVVEYGFV